MSVSMILFPGFVLHFTFLTLPGELLPLSKFNLRK